MWYEILPSMVIVGLVPIIPQLTAYYFNQFFFGNPMRRDLRQEWDRNMFTRDIRIAGSPWNHRGLDDVPDD